MDVEKWYKWEPLEKMVEEYYIDEYYHENLSLFKIILIAYNTPKNIQLHLSIKNLVGHRLTNETYRLNRWGYLDMTHAGYNKRRTLFWVDNSAYLQFLFAESNTSVNQKQLKHYAMFDSEWVLDIATEDEPYCELFMNGELIETSGKLSHDTK